MGLPPTIDQTIEEFETATSCVIQCGSKRIMGVGPLRFAAMLLKEYRNTLQETPAPSCYLHHYQQIGGGSRYVEPALGQACQYPTAKEGYRYVRSERLYTLADAQTLTEKKADDE